MYIMLRNTRKYLLPIGNLSCLDCLFINNYFYSQQVRKETRDILERQNIPCEFRETRQIKGKKIPMDLYLVNETTTEAMVSRLQSVRRPANRRKVDVTLTEAAS